MEIKFENELGVIRFLGSGSGEWRLIDVTGLGLAPRSFETASYSGEAGQVTLSTKLEARTVTISAEVNAKNRNGRAAAVSRAMRILSREGELTVRTFRERSAKCRLNDMQEGSRYGNFRTYAIQFVCDSPYFTDAKDTVTALYKREDLLYDNFVIGDGVVLTRRTSGGTVVNDGDEICEGVMKLAAGGSGEADVYLANVSTGAELKLHIYAGNTYLVDFEERTITDENGNDCLGILSDESYLSDFYMRVGENVLTFVHDGTGEFTLTAEYTYRRRYAEATD